MLAVMSGSNLRSQKLNISACQLLGELQWDKAATFVSCLCGFSASPFWLLCSTGCWTTWIIFDLIQQGLPYILMPGAFLQLIPHFVPLYCLQLDYRHLGLKNWHTIVLFRCHSSVGARQRCFYALCTFLSLQHYFIISLLNSMRKRTVMSKHYCISFVQMQYGTQLHKSTFTRI